MTKFFFLIRIVIKVILYIISVYSSQINENKYFTQFLMG